ncbi:hypothetical protein TWF694_003647 [Orbilia ellipsospora]|uniref:Uncharacterized protein n=1 Tax=Orbilia ellipsospora TaxID=2528407 RepID=A0AAV9WZ62_9PEZI
MDEIPSEEDYILCQGELKGDPDIAGVGVTTSIWITTAVTVVFSCWLWYLRIFRGEDMRNKRYNTVLKCALMLGDIQLATALAIIIASIIIIHSDADTSLYHVFIARGLANTNLTGLGAALLFDTRKQTNWRIRLILLGICLTFFLYWTALSIVEFNGWDSVTPKCFFNNSIIGFEFTDWMYFDIPMAIIGNMWIYLELFGGLEKTLADFDGWVLSLPVKASRVLISLRATARLTGPVHGIILFVTSIIQYLLFVIIAITIGPPSTAPLWSIFYFIWNVYDVQTARASNRHILVVAPSGQKSVSLQGHVNPEDDWGFGQILPLLLLLLPLLQIFDAFTEERAQQYTSMHYMPEYLRKHLNPTSAQWPVSWS